MELNATQAEYHEDRSEGWVHKPTVAFYSDDGSEVRVVGQEGRVTLHDNDVERIDLEGLIEVTAGGYRVRTDRASYTRDKDLIVSPGRVEIAGETMSLSGEVMVVSLHEQRLHVLKDVRTTVAAKATGGS